MKLLFPLAAMAFAAPAAAEVVSADAHGFEIRHSITLVVPQPQAYAAFGQVDRWWSKTHTYSGDPSRLSLTLRPGGCLCERLDGGGGIEHLRVNYVEPNQRVVLTGGLGPLLFEATAGVMDVLVERTAGGSRITLYYRVAGFARGNGAELAPAVDQMLAEQVKRLRLFAAASRPAR
ncbi:MAG: ATPase [Sphingomonas bacterium]|nr:ATPase [Sphingomonas bacterium]